jgi:hypothetical protein
MPVNNRDTDELSVERQSWIGEGLHEEQKTCIYNVH